MTFFIHIGAEKTGSTSIQHFLNLNRIKLQQEGIFFPVAPGVENHTKLMFYARNENTFEEENLTFRLFIPHSTEAFRQELKASLIEEIGHYSPKPQKVIFSNEHCSSRLYHSEELERLRDLFGLFSKDIRIIIYLRRQDDFLLSTYSTNIKSGKNFPFFVPELNEETLHRYDYLRMLDLWASVFGNENLIVKVFDRSTMVNGDVVQDFLSLTGIDINDDYTIPEEKNRSLDFYTMEFLRKFNNYVPMFVRKKLNPDRGNIVNILTEISGPDRIPFDSEELKRFFNLFEKSNREVALKYLGYEDGILFKSNPAMAIAVKGKSTSLDIDQVIGISSSVWIEVQKELRKLRFQNGLLKSEKFIQKKEYQSAITTLENILAMDDSNYKAWEMLLKAYHAVGNKSGINNIMDLLESKNPEFHKRLIKTLWLISDRKHYAWHIIAKYLQRLK
jgi:hypothetical protein